MKLFSAILAALLILVPQAACRAPLASRPGNVLTPQSLIAVTANAAGASSTPTNTPSPSATVPPTHSLSPTPAGTSTPSATPVPVGTFALLFYPPLVLSYDPQAWQDESQYGNNRQRINYLQAKDLETCKVSTQGPTEFNVPLKYKIVQLGNIRYEQIPFPGMQPGWLSFYYVEDHSVPGFNYENGSPILVITAINAEWEACQNLSKKVLATLHVASSQ